VATPTLSYSIENWVTKQKDISRIQAAEMRFLSKVKGCTKSDTVCNEEIRNELQIFC